MHTWQRAVSGGVDGPRRQELQRDRRLSFRLLLHTIGHQTAGYLLRRCSARTEALAHRSPITEAGPLQTGFTDTSCAQEGDTPCRRKASSFVIVASVLLASTRWEERPLHGM